MPIWQPAPGEILLARDSIVFASGTAKPVEGMRWFRDTERKDIQHELSGQAGWPEGPTYTLIPPTPKQAARTAGRFGLGVLGAAVVVALGAILGDLGGTGPGAGHDPGRPRVREDEVDDFPVLWGAPGALARTLPWQLDPARRPAGYGTHAIVTDRRIVIVGLPDGDPGKDEEVLWEVGRERIARVERMRYSEVLGDVKITFTDGSWCRLAPPRLRIGWTILRHLAHPTDLLHPSEMTPRQRKYVQKCAAQTLNADPAREPVVTRRPSGRFLVEVTTKEPVEGDYGIVKDYWHMSKRGRRGAIRRDDL
ncbi:hypothetical protein [Streptomyces sp. NPDC087300]|uniref:hypothetical protein n=1 Tax=Streptomyces sp. NPDC087300 TaxID=3365780 RepID=UPI003801B5A8